MTTSNPFRLISTCVVTVLLASSTYSAEWHVDQNRGDNTNNGQADMPFRTVSRAIQLAKGGDVILLAPGNYEPIAIKRHQNEHLFEGDYVAIRPAPTVTNPVDSISIERINIAVTGKVTATDRPGAFDANLRIQGVRIADGVGFFGARKLQVVGCRLEREGPYVGVAENIEKFAVQTRGSSDVLIKDCEITNTAGGITLYGSDMKAIGNCIHDITHDGIRCISLKDSLIEGNRIYNLDDGVEDGDPRGRGWNRHCDAIHIFIPGPGLPKAKNSGVTIRGNVMYNCESQAIQFNNYLRVKDVWNENITIENNIFGPTRANVINIADPVDGIIVRHNSYIYFPEGRTFQGLGREIHCDNHTFRINPNCKRAEVCNNILCNGFTSGNGWFVSHNVITNKKPHHQITRFDRAVNDAKFEDPDAFDGKLADGSPAIDAGTKRLPPSGIHTTDFYGTQRDSRPDCGAYEVPGRNPAEEPPMPVFEQPAHVFVDDFRDGNLTADPWLNGKHQKGLAWQTPEGQEAWSVETPADDALLSPIGKKGTTWMFTAEGQTWDDYTVTAKIANAYNNKGGGFLLRGNLATGGYLVDLALGKVVLRKRDENGIVQTKDLASGHRLLPHRGDQTYVMSIRDSADGTVITVDADKDGKPELTAVDPDKSFPRGQVGLYNHSLNGWHRINLVSIRIELSR